MPHTHTMQSGMRQHPQPHLCTPQTSVGSQQRGAAPNTMGPRPPLNLTPHSNRHRTLPTMVLHTRLSRPTGHTMPACVHAASSRKAVEGEPPRSLLVLIWHAQFPPPSQHPSDLRQVAKARLQDVTRPNPPKESSVPVSNGQQGIQRLTLGSQGHRQRLHLNHLPIPCLPPKAGTHPLPGCSDQGIRDNRKPP